MNERSNKKWVWLVVGTVLSVLTCIPFFVLGESSIITYHDQLDGEILTYIFHAKYLFSGVDKYMEIMNGIDTTGLAMPAPLFVLLYWLFKPFTAIVFSIVIIKIVGFVGTFLMIDELTDNRFVAFLCGLGFMLLPFYAVYGLCIPGEPLLGYALIRMGKKEVNPLGPWLITAFYTLSSSLALVGFAWVAFLFLITVYALIKRKNFVRYFVALGIMGLFYLLENMGLVKQIIGLGDGFVSHKSEITKSSLPFFEALMTSLFTGADYTKVGQVTFLHAILLALVLVIFVRIRTGKLEGKVKRETITCLLGIGMIFAFSLIYAVYESEPVASFCNSRQGVLHDFNFGRIIWLNPVIWVALLGVSLALIKDALKVISLSSDRKEKNEKTGKVISVLYSVLLVGTTGLFAFKGFYDSDLKSNIMKLIKKDYYMMTFEQFFAEDLFKEAEELIGLDKEDYRVVSLGIYPSAAAYNGFYCLDAYSNNYDVEYKHEFRKVIEKELEKSDYLRQWYDGWGNRCYIVLCESMNYFTFEKRWTPTSSEVDINLDQLRKMGCNYMISASYIFDCEELGMTLLNEEPIQTDGSWYRLWVYRF